MEQEGHADKTESGGPGNEMDETASHHHVLSRNLVWRINCIELR